MQSEWPGIWCVSGCGARPASPPRDGLRRRLVVVPAGAFAGAAGGVLLALAPGSAASLAVVPVLAVIGGACGAIGAAGVGAGLSIAESVFRSRRTLAVTVRWRDGRRHGRPHGAVACAMEPGRACGNRLLHWRRSRGRGHRRRRGTWLWRGDRARQRRVGRTQGSRSPACGGPDGRRVRTGGAGSGGGRPIPRGRHDSRDCPGVAGRTGRADAARPTHRRARFWSGDRCADRHGRGRDLRPRPGTRPDSPTQVAEGFSPRE